MITPFLPLIASVATYLVNMFIKDKAKQEEYRLKILQAVDSYNATALDSAGLRTEYERLKDKLKTGSLLRVFVVYRLYNFIDTMVNACIKGVDIMTKETHEPIGAFGVNETLEVISFGMLTAKGVVDSLKSDGKINPSDYSNFLPAIMQVPDALTGLGSIPSELKELAPEEMVLIRDHILTALPDIGEKWTVIAKESFTIGASILNILNAIKKT